GPTRRRAARLPRPAARPPRRRRRPRPSPGTGAAHETCVCTCGTEDTEDDDVTAVEVEAACVEWPGWAARASPIVTRKPTAEAAGRDVAVEPLRRRVGERLDQAVDRLATVLRDLGERLARLELRPELGFGDAEVGRRGVELAEVLEVPAARAEEERQVARLDA